MGSPYWDLCECQAGYGDIAKITEVTVFLGLSFK